MKRHHLIGIDVHCQFCEIAVVDAVGKVVCCDRCATTIPTLLAVLEKVPRPRSLVVEEGPLAGWLWRGLTTAVERMVGERTAAESTDRQGRRQGRRPGRRKARPVVAWRLNLAVQSLFVPDVNAKPRKAQVGN